MVTLKDLTKGDIYVAIYDGGREFINKHDAIGSTYAYINIADKKFYSSYAKVSTSNIREATPEEKFWLLECIRLNKFVLKREEGEYPIF